MERLFIAVYFLVMIIVAHHLHELTHWVFMRQRGHEVDLEWNYKIVIRGVRPLSPRAVPDRDFQVSAMLPLIWLYPIITILSAILVVLPNYNLILAIFPFALVGFLSPGDIRILATPNETKEYVAQTGEFPTLRENSSWLFQKAQEEFWPPYFIPHFW